MNFMEIQHEILLVLCWLLAYPVSDNHRFSELPPKLCLVGLEIELSPSSRGVVGHPVHKYISLSSKLIKYFEYFKR